MTGTMSRMASYTSIVQVNHMTGLHQNWSHDIFTHFQIKENNGNPLSIQKRENNGNPLFVQKKENNGLQSVQTFQISENNGRASPLFPLI